MELDKRAAGFDARRFRGARFDRHEPELLVGFGGLFGSRRPQGHVVEVVVDLRRRLDQAEPQPLADFEVDLSVARPLDLKPIAELPLRALKARDAQRDVLERALLARSVGGEQRQFAAPGIRADEREGVRPIDHVHPDALGQEVGDPVAVGHPEGDVVERLRPHAGQDNGPLLPGVDCSLKLLLVHLRAIRDVLALGLVVELLLGAAALAPRARPEPASAARRDVTTRRARRLSRFAGTRPLLVDRPGSDLLGPLRRAALLLLALLDVLVLAFALVAPGSLRHADPSSVGSHGTCPGGRVLCLYSSGGFWTLCSVAYSSVSLLITSAPSP